MHENVLVRCMNSVEIHDFVANIVCRDKYKIKSVTATESINRYIVVIIVKNSIFPKKRVFKTCEFIAYDDHFEFGDMNEDGKFNSWWLGFLLVRCTKYLKDYLPNGENEEEYSYKVHQFLREKKIVFVSGLCEF